MKLFSFSIDNQFGIGVETEDGVFDLSRAFEIYQKVKGAKETVSVAFLQMLVEMGYCSGMVIENILEEPWVKSKMHSLTLPEKIRLDVPIARPSKIICMGRNYAAHAKELDHTVPKEPIFFCKAPSTLIAHHDEIIIPAWLDTRVDYEAELAVIMGKTCKNVPEGQALDFVAGYTLLNDITARDMQKEDMAASSPWFRSKSVDSFCPVGPYVIPADTVNDPHNLEIRLTQNGETRQAANTGDMIFKIPQIISHLSRFMTLFPGDIIATGTPEGVGPVKHGDTLQVACPEIGILENRVIQEK